LSHVGGEAGAVSHDVTVREPHGWIASLEEGSIAATVVNDRLGRGMYVNAVELHD
jgi:hypothetical protein